MIRDQDDKGRDPRRRFLRGAALVAVALLLYLPSLRYGLIWDDPMWYAQSTGPSLWETLTALDTYRYYRPLAILLNRLLVRPDGVVRHALAHAIQIVAHALATLCVPRVLRHLGCDARASWFGALFFCLHPYAYQAVAWQAPQQPIVTLLVMSAYLAVERFDVRRRVGWLALSMLAFAAALLFQESALPFGVLLVWPALRAWLQPGAWRRANVWQRSLWVLAYLALALGFVWIWGRVPHISVSTGPELDPRVLAFVLQGVVFPVAAAVGAASLPLSAQATSALYGAVALLLGLARPTRRERRVGRRALALTAIGLSVVWFFLGWRYVQVGSRLFYPALLGSSMLWGSWLAWGWQPRAPVGKRLVGGALLLSVVAVAAIQWRAFDRLQSLGSDQIARTVAVMRARDGQRLLFVNYPDRIRLRRQPYSLGYWGLTLAPISQDLAGFGQAMGGAQVETRSRSAFQVGAGDRERYPYQVDMRGSDTPASEMLDHALWADAVYLTHYLSDGELALAHVGAVSPDAGAQPRATLGSAVEVVSWAVSQPDPVTRRITVELTLRPGDRAEPQDTLFLHLLTPERALVAGHDGDALGGMLPLSIWPAGIAVYDVRPIDCADLPPGEYILTMGCYNRVTGHRYQALDAEGQRYWDDEVILGHITLD